MRQLPIVPAVVVLVVVLTTLGAPRSAGAAIAQPTDLRPVQSKADCVAALSLLAVICDAAVRAGDLQLIWDESDKPVSGYKVYQYGGRGETFLGTAPARYYVIKKSPEGYAHLCFAVAASVGNVTSPVSQRYCYAPGATATTRLLQPSRTATVVPYLVVLNCPPNTYQSGTSYSPRLPGVTMLLPWLPYMGQGKHTQSGTYVGNVAAPHVPVETQSCQNSSVASVSVWMNAFAGIAFDTGWLRGVRIYSANLTLTAMQTVTGASGTFTLSKGGWCSIWVRAAIDPWWGGPSGNLFGSTKGEVKVVSRPATGTIDVTSVVEAYDLPYGIILMSPDTPGNAPQNNYLVPNATNTCLTKFSPPSLQVVYF